MRFWFLSALFWWMGLQSVAQTVQTYQKNNLFGLADYSGKPLTDAIYTEIKVGTDYSIIRVWDQAKAIYATGTIDQKGKPIIEPSYVDLKRDGLRLLACKKINQTFRYGLLHANGKEIIPIDFISIESLGSMRYAVENDTRKFAIYTDVGNNLTGFTIENLVPIKSNLIQFKQNGLLGLLDRQGNILRDAKYTELHVKGDTIVGLLPQQWALISLSTFSQTLIQAKHVAFTPSGNLIISKEKNNAQLFTKTLHPIGEVHTEILCTENPLYFIVRDLKTYSIMNMEGKQLPSTTSDSILIKKNFAWIKKGNTWQTFSLKEQKYNIGKFNSFRNLNEYTVVRKQNFEGVVDTMGEEIIPCVYDSILAEKENLLLVKLKNLYGILDTKENWVLPPQPFRIKLVNDKLYLLLDGKLQYLKNFNHKIVYFSTNTLHIEKDHIEEITSRGEKWKIDSDGIVTALVPKVTSQFQQILLPTEGLSAIKKDKRWGFVDEKGRLRIANRYDSVLSFTFGTAAFKLRNKWGLLNKEDKIVLQPTYDSILRTSENTMVVFQKKSGGIINPSGKVVLPLRFDAVIPWINKFYLLRKDKTYGWADENGNLVVDPKYESIKPTSKLLAAKILNVWGLVDYSGLQIIPAVYQTCSISADNQYALFSKEVKAEAILLK